MKPQSRRYLAARNEQAEVLLNRFSYNCAHIATVLIFFAILIALFIVIDRFVMGFWMWSPDPWVRPFNPYLH